AASRQDECSRTQGQHLERAGSNAAIAKMANDPRQMNDQEEQEEEGAADGRRHRSCFPTDEQRDAGGYEDDAHDVRRDRTVRKPRRPDALGERSIDEMLNAESEDGERIQDAARNEEEIHATVQTSY